MKYILTILLFTVAHLASAQYSGTPIMLSLPMDGDTIQEDEPVFVWQTTLSNLQNDPRLNVQLSVVEMEEDQTATEAIAENNPVFTRQNLLSSSLTYSSIDHELEEGVWYAWQVVLFYNGVQVQQSEVWKFIKAEPVVPVLPFIVLRRQKDNSVHELEGETLYVCTREHGDFSKTAILGGNGMSDVKVQLKEVDAQGNAIEAGSTNLDTRYYTCDLDDLNLKHGNYRLQWNASDNMNFILFFEK